MARNIIREGYNIEVRCDFEPAHCTRVRLGGSWSYHTYARAPHISWENSHILYIAHLFSILICRALFHRFAHAGQGGCCEDICVTACCHTCVVAQMLNEVSQRGNSSLRMNIVSVA
jgi:hypothetical protein